MARKNLNDMLDDMSDDELKDYVSKRRKRRTNDGGEVQVINLAGRSAERFLQKLGITDDHDEDEDEDETDDEDDEQDEDEPPKRKTNRFFDS